MAEPLKEEDSRSQIVEQINSLKAAAKYLIGPEKENVQKEIVALETALKFLPDKPAMKVVVDEPAAKKSIFGTAKVKAPTKVAAKEDKTVVEIPGLGTKLMALESLKAEIADRTAQLSAITNEVKDISKDKFLELYKANKENPNTFLIKDGGGCVMVIPTDGYISIKDEDRADQLRKEYGDNVVEVTEKFYFTPAVLARNQDAIEELIMKATTISEEDKENLLTKEVKYSIKKGTIDHLLDYGKKMDNLFIDAQPTFQLKICGESSKKAGGFLEDGGELIIDPPVLRGYSLCHYAPVYGEADVCTTCGDHCIVASESELQNQLAEISNEGSEENEQWHEARGYAEGGGLKHFVWNSSRYIKYSDPGHGWLKVPKEDLVALGIADKISSYSYMLGNNAYLEEDSDMSTFLEAAKVAAGFPDYSFWQNVKDSITDNQSRIRGYASYRHDKLFRGGAAARTEEYEVSVGNGVYWGYYHFDGNKLRLDSILTHDDKEEEVEVTDQKIIDAVYRKVESDKSDEVYAEAEYNYDEFAGGGRMKPVKLFFGHLGNGVTVWDTNRKEPHTSDSLHIAHISEDGETITYYDKNLPQSAFVEIQKAANSQNKLVKRWGSTHQWINEGQHMVKYAPDFVEKLNKIFEKDKESNTTEPMTIENLHSVKFERTPFPNYHFEWGGGNFGWIKVEDIRDLSDGTFGIIQLHGYLPQIQAEIAEREKKKEGGPFKEDRVFRTGLGRPHPVKYFDVNSSPSKKDIAAKLKSKIKKKEEGGFLKPNEVRPYWTKEAEKWLLGKTVALARMMSKKEGDAIGWDDYDHCLVIQFTDGTVIYPSADDEGNGAGFFELNGDTGIDNYEKRMQQIKRATVTNVCYFPTENMAELGWGSAPVQIELTANNNEIIFVTAQRDPEGNDGGAIFIFGQKGKENFTLPVI